MNEFVNIIKGILVGVAAIAIYVIFIRADANEGIVTGPLNYNRGVVEVPFSISKRSGKIGVVVEQNGYEKCMSWFEAQQGFKYNIHIKCRLGDGKYKIVYGWADRHEKAKRAVMVGNQITFKNE